MRSATKTKEQQLKGANNLKQIRELSNKHPEQDTEIKEAIQPTKELIGSVFQRLQLKKKHFKVFSAADRQQINEMANNLKNVDTDFDASLILNTSKPCKPSPKYKDFMHNHSKQGHYQFSIMKCSNAACVCGEPRAPPEGFEELHHLPYPIPHRDHYKTSEV